MNHPNLCTIFEIDEEHDFAIQACAGPQAAHEKGIVHRDIKPANLMLTANGQVKIMDFGLAQIGDRTRITKSGASVGTPAYMSPEQPLGQPTDRRADIGSIRVVLYEMLAGRVPFPGQTEAACAYAIVHTDQYPLTAAGHRSHHRQSVAQGSARPPSECRRSGRRLAASVRSAGRGIPILRQAKEKYAKLR